MLAVVLVLGAVSWLCAWWGQGAGVLWLWCWCGVPVLGAGCACGGDRVPGCEDWVPVLGAGAGCCELVCRCCVLALAARVADTGCRRWMPVPGAGARCCVRGGDCGAGAGC